MNSFRRRRQITCWRVALVVSALLTFQPAVGQDPPEKSDEGQADCTVQLEGRHIEKLVLTTKEHGQKIIERPGESFSLPAGDYAVEEVHIEDEYIGRHPAFGQDWFTLTLDMPHVLKFGAPLTSKLAVTRQGSTFTLDYSLVDAEGFEYQSNAINDTPPRFAVYQDGQEIGSGTFSYG